MKRPGNTDLPGLGPASVSSTTDIYLFDRRGNGTGGKRYEYHPATKVTTIAVFPSIIAPGLHVASQ